METSEETLSPVQEAPTQADPQSSFASKLAEIRTREGYQEGSFAANLESEGVDVEVTPKLEVAPTAAAPAIATEVVEDDGSAGVDAVMGAISASEASIAAEQTTKAGLEQRALTLGVPAGLAKSMAYRSPQGETEAYLAKLEQQAHNVGAGQAVPTAESAANGLAPAPTSPGIESLLRDGGLEEDTASAIAAEFGALKAELAEVRGQAATAASITEHATRTQARGDFDAAVGELSGDCPGLVQGSGIDAQVGQIAKGLLATPVYEGDLKGALRAAWSIRFPDASGEPRQTLKETPRPTTLAPAAAAPSSANPLRPAEGFARLAQTAGKYKNDPAKLAAHLNQQAGRIRAQNEAARKRA